MEQREKTRATKIVDRMYDNDPFSIWLGIERLEDAPGRSVLRMQVRDEMTNGFGVAHGGITFSLADSALAFASNARGKMAMSIDCNINHQLPVRSGDVLTAEVREVSCGNRIGVYNIEVVNQENKLVAAFKGTVYRKSEEWDV